MNRMAIYFCQILLFRVIDAGKVDQRLNEDKNIFIILFFNVSQVINLPRCY